MRGIHVRRDLGDFQTPPALAAAVLESLGKIGVRWPRVLEPTCGQGGFVTALLNGPSPPREIQAVEIQQAHCEQARASVATRDLSRTRVEIVQANLFELDLKRDLRWREDGPLLVIGNPPWVTSAELGAMGKTCRLKKWNLKALPGIEARTGASNFDLAEAVWLKLLRELADLAPTLALLCKTSVARRVLQFAQHDGIGITAASIHRIDAARWFGAATGACLFRIKMGSTTRSVHVPVFSGLGRDCAEPSWGFARGWLVQDLEAHRRVIWAAGASPWTWRQGLKHDAAAVMELIRDRSSGLLYNRAGERVDLELDFVYPLVKGADLKHPAVERPLRSVIVTQKCIGEDTRSLAMRAPRLWRYLEARADSFARRKSSIYRDQPPFALFGVGPYSFSCFKVAISGLHKTPAFRALGPLEGRPVMLDDTCYFLPCESAEQAAVLTALCNDPITLEFVRSASFPDAKRPITKALLGRVDLGAVLARTDRAALLPRAASVLANELTPKTVAPSL
jgi:hypothetical protein